MLNRCLVAPCLPVPKLRSLAFNRVLDEVFNSEANTDLTSFESAELLSDFLREVRQRLYQNPSLLETSPHAIPLLAKVLASENKVDLSPFRTLTPPQLFQLLDQSKCTSLDLAGILHITQDVLAQILKKMPQLKSLNVMGISHLSLNDLSAMISGSGIRQLSHSHMYSKYFEISENHQDRTIESSMSALMFGDVSPVVQLLYVHNAFCSDHQRLANGGLPLTRINNRTDGYQPQICPVPLYLGSTFLPVDKLILGLTNQIILSHEMGIGI